MLYIQGVRTDCKALLVVVFSDVEPRPSNVITMMSDVDKKHLI
jgi:hypothetical protein